MIQIVQTMELKAEGRFKILKARFDRKQKHLIKNKNSIYQFLIEKKVEICKFILQY